LRSLGPETSKAGGAVDCGGIERGEGPGSGQFAAGVTFCKAGPRARWRLRDTAATLLARGKKTEAGARRGGAPGRGGQRCARRQAKAGSGSKCKKAAHCCAAFLLMLGMTGVPIIEIWSG